MTQTISQQMTKYKMNQKFDSFQLEEIEEGLELGLDVSIYANPVFDFTQMNEIKQGLKEKIKAKLYAKPEFNYLQMSQIRQGLNKDINILSLCNSDFDATQMQQVRLGLQNGLDKQQVRKYAKLIFNHRQMEQIRRALEENIVITKLLNPKLTYREMENIRLNRGN